MRTISDDMCHIATAGAATDGFPAAAAIRGNAMRTQASQAAATTTPGAGHGPV